MSHISTRLYATSEVMHASSVPPQNSDAPVKMSPTTKPPPLKVAQSIPGPEVKSSSSATPSTTTPTTDIPIIKLLPPLSAATPLIDPTVAISIAPIPLTSAKAPIHQTFDQVPPAPQITPDAFDPTRHHADFYESSAKIYHAETRVVETTADHLGDEVAVLKHNSIIPVDVDIVGANPLPLKSELGATDISSTPTLSVVALDLTIAPLSKATFNPSFGPKVTAVAEQVSRATLIQTASSRILALLGRVKFR